MNTKARHKEIYTVAAAELEKIGGVETVDGLENLERLRILRQMYRTVADITNCHYDTAKRNVAKAMRRARYGVMKARWGGKRAGAGRPSKSR